MQLGINLLITSYFICFILNLSQCREENMMVTGLQIYQLRNDFQQKHEMTVRLRSLKQESLGFYFICILILHIEICYRF